MLRGLSHTQKKCSKPPADGQSEHRGQVSTISQQPQPSPVAAGRALALGLGDWYGRTQTRRREGTRSRSDGGKLESSMAM
jgi:hypothetical protein